MEIKKSIKLILFFLSIVHAGDFPAGQVNNREKRQAEALIELITLNEDQIAYFVDGHNEYRRMEGASNMQLMSWDGELAEYAQRHVENCQFEHSTALSTGNYSRIGENLYIFYTSSSELSEAPIYDSLKPWYDEKENYNYEANSCDAVCGHYTQMVWADSYKLGCAAALCISKRENTDHSVLVSCNYYQPGNFRGQLPYETGPACSNCPTGFIQCSDGLCSSEEQLTSTLSSTSSNPPSTSSNPPSTSSNPPSTSSNPPSTSTNPPSTSSNPPSTPSNPPSTSSNPPSAPSNPPSTSSNPPSTPSNPPSTSTNPPSTPSNPPSTPSNPPSTSANPSSTPTNPPPTTTASDSCNPTKDGSSDLQQWREAFSKWQEAFRWWEERFEL